MHNAQNTVASHEYLSVPITALADPVTNPRKRFDAKSLEELAASVPRHIIGLLWPWLFCGGERTVALGNGGSHFRRAHNVGWRNLSFVRRYEILLKLSDSAEPQSPVCS